MQNKVLATVEGREITQGEVFQFLNELGQAGAQFQSEEGLNQLLIELVNQELFYLDAKENKVDETEEFQELLEKTKENLLKNYAVNNLLKDVQVNEEELREYFEDNKNMFNRPESVRASHILVNTEEEANNIKKELDEGLKFEDAASKYSSCPSKEKGGDLGQFQRGQMVPEFEEAAFAMEEGTISEPVQSQFGYHIIKLVEHFPVGESSFEEVLPQLQQVVLQLKQQQTYLDRVEELKGKYKVEIK